MEQITRNGFLAGLATVKTIQSVKFHRRVNKVVKRCVHCDAETASHEGERFCNACDDFVATYDSTEADAGDVVQMQFIPRIPPRGTKNFTPAGGYIFNAPSLEAAQEILTRNRLVQCLKMGEQMPDNLEDAEARRLIESGDLKAMPRCFGVDDVTEWKAEGQHYVITD